MYVVASAGKGDYERLLISGMSGHLSRWRGRIRLERVGPFIPPLSVSGHDLIATKRMIEMLSKSPFNNWSLRPVVKSHVAFWEWKNLAEASEDAAEPEDIILRRPHDKTCAKALGDLFELIPPVECAVLEVKRNRSLTRCSLKCDALPKSGLFRSMFPGGAVPMCSDKFRQWIERHQEIRKWLRFLPAAVEVTGQ